MPHWRDFKAKRLARRAWSEAEMTLLRSGQPVPTRTIVAYKAMRLKIGIIIGRPRRFADAPYEAPKPVPGKIPWPKWWDRAHAMRTAGFGAYEIARLLKQDREAVRAALYPSVDAIRKQKLRRLRAKKRQDPEYREQERLTRVDHDPERTKARVLARAAWRETGGHPHALEGFYRRYECL